LKRPKNAVVKIDKYSNIGGNSRLTDQVQGFVFFKRRADPDKCTCYENSDRLNVSLLDGNEFSGETIGMDKDTDIAIIKVIRQWAIHL